MQKCCLMIYLLDIRPVRYYVFDMLLPNAVTTLRIVLSPVFFVVFFIPVWTGTFVIVSVVLLWILFLIIELSDFFDGMIARSLNQVSDIGKLLDPFSDVFSRLTYFISFALVDIMPEWILIILVYRELGISFLRLLMLKKGIALAARWGGKIKAVTYACAGIIGLLVLSFERLRLWPDALPILKTTAFCIFVLAAASSLLSFVDYIRVFKKTPS